MGTVKPPFVYLGTTVFKETVEETRSHIDRLMNKKSSSKNVVTFNMIPEKQDENTRNVFDKLSNKIDAGDYKVVILGSNG